MKRPVIYLDVDGCILRHPDTPMFPDRATFERWWMANPYGGPANGVQEFLEWATTHCEVRWLTAWAACGEMGDTGTARLAQLLRVPVELLAGIRNPLSWDFDAFGIGKCSGIDWREHAAGRPWVWLDDETLGREMAYLRSRRAVENLLICDSSKNPDAIVHALATLKRRFALAPLSETTGP